MEVPALPPLLTIDEVTEVMKNMKNKKATGLDGFCVEQLKQLNYKGVTLTFKAKCVSVSRNEQSIRILTLSRSC